MQSIAFSLGLPTTAFVVPAEAEQYQIRWFTPEKELNICGHATIASAGYLYEIENINRSAELCFHTQYGPLYAHREDHYVSVNLPRMDVSACDPPTGLEEALGARILYCGRAIDDVLIEVESEDVVANLRPNFEQMRKIECRGHVVTAKSDNERADFVSRSFFPALGVNEDQVCVSAHCKLGPYWAEKLNKHLLSAVQVSPRGGRLVLEVTGDRVNVAGTAVVRGTSGPLVG
jgi:PhzF family phenazine biosynthesis protein